MGKFADYIINAVRWPVAVLLVCLMPSVLLAYRYINFHAPHFYALGCGVVFFCFSAMASGYNIRHAMQIIAHEFTHALFALLTFHFVGKIRLNPDESGGSMMLKGRGNWLITLSPYFFPLPAFIYMLIMPMFINEVSITAKFLSYCILGYFLAYYWSTVLSQVHKEQADIIKEGYFFSSIIIVCGNLLITTMIFAYCSKLWHGVVIYFDLLYKLNVKILEYLSSSIF